MKPFVYCVERMVAGRLEWLRIEGSYKEIYREWTGSFCLLEENYYECS